MSELPINSEQFFRMCKVAKTLDLASRTRLDRIADAPVDVYEQAWSVASSEAYRDAIIAWRGDILSALKDRASQAAYAALGLVVRFAGSLCFALVGAACDCPLTPIDPKPCGNDILGCIYICVVHMTAR